MSLEEIILKYALYNAVKYGGKADVKAVMSKVMSEKPELRSRAREVKQLVEKIIEKVNSISIDEQRRILSERWPELLEEKRVEYKKTVETLPRLPNDDKYEVITLRFAPNPDFVLTLGNARPAVLNYAYKLKYEEMGRKAKFILRFEDTDPRTKKPLLEAYDLIKEDLKWLGIKWDEEYIQSDRMEIYYEMAKKLIEKGGAYVVAEKTKCTPKDWEESKRVGKPCSARNESPEYNLELFEKMLSGHYGEGEAVLVVKTDLNHPDPSVRDWVAMRIIDTTKYPHPRTGSKYIVWPTYNFAVAIDDYLMRITHILRAQEHYVNTIKQSYIYQHMNWKMPETIHFGRLMIEGATLSKSKLKALGLSYDDITLPTLAGLRNRGIQPEAIWEIILHVGIKSTDATISLENLYTINRRILEPKANRYMMIHEPVRLVIEKVYEVLEAKIPYHPSYPDRGYRVLKLEPKNGKIELYINKSDIDYLIKNGMVRLMDLANIKLKELRDNEVLTEVHSLDLDTARKLKLQIIQWVSSTDNVKVIIKKPVNNYRIIIEEGFGEKYLLQTRPNDIVQFVRYGFVKIRKVERDLVECNYVHD